MSHHKVTFSIYFNPLIYEVHTALTLPNLKSLWFKTQKYAKCNVEGVPVNPHCFVPKEDMKWKENTRPMESLFRYAPTKFFIVAKNNCNKKTLFKLLLKSHETSLFTDFFFQRCVYCSIKTHPKTCAQTVVRESDGGLGFDSTCHLYHFAGLSSLQNLNPWKCQVPPSVSAQQLVLQRCFRHQSEAKCASPFEN